MAICLPERNSVQSKWCSAALDHQRNKFDEYFSRINVETPLNVIPFLLCIWSTLKSGTKIFINSFAPQDKWMWDGILVKLIEFIASKLEPFYYHTEGFRSLCTNSIHIRIHHICILNSFQLNFQRILNAFKFKSTIELHQINTKSNENWRNDNIFP